VIAERLATRLMTLRNQEDLKAVWSAATKRSSEPRVAASCAQQAQHGLKARTISSGLERSDIDISHLRLREVIFTILI